MCKIAGILAIAQGGFKMFDMKRVLLVGVISVGFAGNGIVAANSVDQDRQYLLGQEDVAKEVRSESTQMASLCWNIIVGGGRTVYYCLPLNQSV